LNSSNGVWVNGKRIAVKTFLKHGDKIHLGKTVFRLRIGNLPLPAQDAAAAPRQKNSMWLGWAAIVALIGVALVITCIATIPAIVMLTRKADPTAANQPAVTLAANEATGIAQEALRSLALIVVPDQNSKTNDTYYSGSGSFINKDGYILTNFHVIGYTEREAQTAGKNMGDLINNLHNGEELILAGVNWSNPLAAPDTFYRCAIIQSDPKLDLALLRVVEVYNSGSDAFEPLPADLTFPVIAIGNSDDLKILEPITIIGFPGVGGNTPTVIDDQVAGFSPDDDYNIKDGWIKTGPVISHGNSGGMAINQKGELIGVPTQVMTFEADKIGYIRPIKLALPLIQEFLP
jgi:putative serine protease PepD